MATALPTNNVENFEFFDRMASTIKYNQWDSNHNTWLHWQILTWNSPYSQKRFWKTFKNLDKLYDIIPQINILNDLGFTPLHLAVIAGDSELVKELILFGGNSKIKCTNPHFKNNTSIDIALYFSNIPVIRSILEGLNTND